VLVLETLSSSGKQDLSRSGHSEGRSPIFGIYRQKKKRAKGKRRRPRIRRRKIEEKGNEEV
jgi:hypothetical protein